MTDAATATRCPRCGGGVLLSQEFCLDCGLSLPGRGRFGALPVAARSLLVPLAVAGIVAIAGAALAIWLTRDEAAPAAVITAIGGSAKVSVPEVATGTRLAGWPLGRDGWTISLAVIPKSAGRDAAVARAQQARTQRAQGGRRARLVSLGESPTRRVGRLLGYLRHRARSCQRTSSGPRCVTNGSGATDRRLSYLLGSRPEIRGVESSHARNPCMGPETATDPVFLVWKTLVRSL